MILKRNDWKGNALFAADGFRLKSPKNRVSSREAVMTDSEARGDETKGRDAARWQFEIFCVLKISAPPFLFYLLKEKVSLNGYEASDSTATASPKPVTSQWDFLFFKASKGWKHSLCE